jgi:putative thioredoxin
MNTNIVNILETNFENEVIEYSKEMPVVVDFWAPWCTPCRTLGPLLEKLAVEANGAFRLAKVNVDDNPGLSARFGIQGIPMVIAFLEGKTKGQFIGAQPESAVRKFLHDLHPGPADRLLAEATGLITSRHWAEAEKAARNALALEPGSSAAALLIMKSLLAQGRGILAQDVLRNFPPGNEVVAAQRLQPLANLLAEAEAGNPPMRDDLEAEYLQAARLLAKGNFPAALDGLLDILRHDKRYRNDEVRRVFLAALEILGEEDPLTRQYRDELASALF